MLKNRDFSRYFSPVGADGIGFDLRASFHLALVYKLDYILVKSFPLSEEFSCVQDMNVGTYTKYNYT